MICISRFFIFFLLALCTLTYGQNTAKLDSLFKALKTEKKDSNTVKTLIRISQEYQYNDAKKSLQYAEEVLKISEEIKWNKGIARAYFYAGSAFYSGGNFAEALNYRLKELAIWKELKYEKNVCIALGNIGVCYSDLGDNVKAIEYYIFSLELAKKLNMKGQAINNLTNIASIYGGQKNTEKALQYYFQSLELAEKNGYEENIGINLANIANVYSSLGNYAKALEADLRALKIAEVIQNKNLISSVLSNIGAAYQLQGDSANKAGNTDLLQKKSNKSLEYYFRSLTCAEEMGNDYLRAYALGNIGAIYITLHRFKEAKEYIGKCLETATKINSIEVIADAHQRFWDLYKKTNMTDKALEHYEQYIVLRDSLYKEENKKTIAELEIKYEAGKKEAENKSLLQENKVKSLEISNNRFLMAGLAGLLVLVLGLGYLLIRQNKLKAQQLAIQFEQKLLRTQMNPHFIFNSLASIESFIYDHQPKEAGVYLSNFSKLMRLILENSSLEYITLEKEIEFLNYYLSLQKLRLDDNLAYTIEVDKNMDTGQIYLPPMLTQPFIENAIEHGFRGSKKQGDIKIVFNLIGDNLEVQIIDNGIGIDKAQQQKDLHKTHKSMAMQITMERLALLNKSKKKKLSFSYKDMANEQAGLSGTKIVFLIPL